MARQKSDLDKRQEEASNYALAAFKASSEVINGAPDAGIAMAASFITAAHLLSSVALMVFVSDAKLQDITSGDDDL